ncbi:acyl-CoA thioesterase II [Aspergillus granulosus]|uniref:Acyl-CoA thioesterase II n=1 Tax=Aspergillus granulosus TaxID=176169 RepID=A0ABR4HE03_9EURO
MAPKPSRLAAQTLAAQLSLSPTGTGPDTFQTQYLPERMGNAANYAYGGCALGTGVQAAYQTVTQGYHPYSVTGSFLAPVSIDIKLECSVRRLRDTRTFATRQVEVSQGQSDGSSRLCMILLVDFHKEGEKPLLTYSVAPDRAYSSPEDSLTPQEIAKRMAQQGTITEKSAEQYNVLFGLMARFFETRQASEGIGAQNLTGMAKHQATDQDHLPLPSKTTADWLRCRTPLQQRSDQYSGLAFILDSYLSFLPLVHSKMFIHDASACASLDFALRIFSTEWDLTEWNLREMKTVAGGDGRTYSETRLWNREGRLIANMTQQSILRPNKEVRASL